jgi:hypothetical protein
MSTHLHLIVDGETLPTPALSMADGAARSLSATIRALGAELPTDAPPRRIDSDACADILRTVHRASFAEVEAAIADAFPELQAGAVGDFFDDVLRVVAAARSADGMEVR